MLWLLSYELWLLGYVGGASIQPDAGEFHAHWNSWQPWVCMCDLHKQGRIRHFVVWELNITFNLKASDFWQEKACSLHDCAMCLPDQCPSSAKSPWSRFDQEFRGLSSTKPHEVEIPLPVETELPSFDSLPSMDDIGQK